MSKIYFGPVLSFIFLLRINAQDKPVIITDRDGRTISSATVPHKNLQIESGFLYEKISEDHTCMTFNSTLLRYGLYKMLEIRLQSDHLQRNISPHDKKYYSPFTVGMKIQLCQERQIIPQTAVVTGINFIKSGTEKPESVNPFIKIAFSNTLSKNISLRYNLGTGLNDSITFIEYSFALRTILTKNLANFIEICGEYNRINENYFTVIGGFEYLLNETIRLDVYGGNGLFEKSEKFIIGLGFVIRIPD